MRTRARIKSRDALFWRFSAGAAWCLLLAPSFVDDIGANANPIAFSVWTWCVGAAAGIFTIKAALTPALLVEFDDKKMRLRTTGTVRAIVRDFPEGEVERVFLSRRRNMGGECPVRARTKFGEELDLYRSVSSRRARHALAVATAALFLKSQKGEQVSPNAAAAGKKDG